MDDSPAPAARTADQLPPLVLPQPFPATLQRLSDVTAALADNLASINDAVERYAVPTAATTPSLRPCRATGPFLFSGAAACLPGFSSTSPTWTAWRRRWYVGTGTASPSWLRFRPLTPGPPRRSPRHAQTKFAATEARPRPQ